VCTRTGAFCAVLVYSAHLASLLPSLFCLNSWQTAFYHRRTTHSAPPSRTGLMLSIAHAAPPTFCYRRRDPTYRLLPRQPRMSDLIRTATPPTASHGAREVHYRYRVFWLQVGGIRCSLLR